VCVCFILPMLETAVRDRSWPMKIPQYAIAIDFMSSGDCSWPTRPMLIFLGLGSSSEISLIPV